MNKLLFILLLLPTWLLAQTPNWRTVNVDPPIVIENLQVDTLGFLWMNDDSVLYRYNGIEVVPKINLTEERITSLVYNVDRFLIGTSNGRVLAFNPYNSTLSVLLDRSDKQPVTDILYKNKDNFVLLSYGYGIGLMQEGVLTFINTESGLISNEVYDISLFNDRYYLATDQGIQILDPKDKSLFVETLTNKDGLSDLVITQLMQYDNKLWYTDYDRHLGVIDDNHSIENYKFPAQSKVNQLKAYRSGFYIATDDGLLKFTDGVFSSQYPMSGTEKVTLLEMDEEGNIWTAASEGKLLISSIYFQSLKVYFSDIRAIAKYENTFIIGNQEGLYTYSNNTINKLNNNNITHIITVNGYLVVGTFSEGVKVYDDHLNLVYELKNWSGIENQSVLHLYYYNGFIYISSLSGVMKFTFQNGQIAPKQSLNSMIGPGYIYSMVALRDKMYFGTDRNGLIIWNIENNKIDKYNTFEKGEKIGSIYALSFDSEGKLWFTSSTEGLGVLDDKKTVKLRNQRNIIDKYTSLTTLSNGSLLAVRSASVDLVDPETHHIMYFDKEIGIKTEESYLNTVIHDNHQTYFVHDHNIYCYTPYPNIKIHPEVIIDAIMVNLSLTEGKNKFTEDENNIEFNYSGSWLTDPSKLTFQYKLVGFDDDWRVTKDNSVAFRKLPPNHYTFRLRASENGQFNDEPEVSYYFEIQRYFYNEWWFKVLGFVVIGFGLWLIIQTKENRKKEKISMEKLTIENQLINLKNQLNPHFLFNAFNTLIGLIEEDTERSIEFLERMTDFYRNMLEYGKLNMISLAQEKEMLNEYIHILKARFNGQLLIKLDIDDHPENYEIPPMTLQLLLENAIKHNVVSTQNPLRVSIIQSKDTITIKNRRSDLLSESRGTKTGLQNIKRRFDLVNLPTPIINDAKDHFEVILILRKLNK